MNRLRSIEQSLVLQCLDVKDYVHLAQTSRAWGDVAQTPFSAIYLQIAIDSPTPRSDVDTNAHLLCKARVQSRFLQHVDYRLGILRLEMCLCQSSNTSTCVMCCIAHLLQHHSHHLVKLRVYIRSSEVTHRVETTMLSFFRPEFLYKRLYSARIRMLDREWTSSLHPDVFSCMPGLRWISFHVESLDDLPSAELVAGIQKRWGSLPSTIEAAYVSTSSINFATAVPLPLPRLPLLPKLEVLSVDSLQQLGQQPTQPRLRYLLCGKLYDSDASFVLPTTIKELLIAGIITVFDGETSGLLGSHTTFEMIQLVDLVQRSEHIQTLHLNIWLGIPGPMFQEPNYTPLHMFIQQFPLDRIHLHFHVHSYSRGIGMSSNNHFQSLLQPHLTAEMLARIEIRYHNEDEEVRSTVDNTATNDTDSNPMFEVD